MRLHKTIACLALTGTVLLASAGSAMAAQAVATTNVNVRSGPGAGYAAVDVLRRNEVVNVTNCRGGWCYVEKAGPDGWVSANYLEGGGRRPGYAPQPSIGFSFSFGNVQEPPRPPRHPRPPRPSYGGWDNNDGYYGGWDGYHDDYPRRRY